MTKIISTEMSQTEVEIYSNIPGFSRRLSVRVFQKGDGIKTENVLVSFR